MYVVSYINYKQVFLGMVASSVPPKRGMSSLIEDMMAAGVRFVYFSPRNMRRSKVSEQYYSRSNLSIMLSECKP
jgi:hypothetical protein